VATPQGKEQEARCRPPGPPGLPVVSAPQPELQPPTRPWLAGSSPGVADGNAILPAAHPPVEIHARHLRLDPRLRPRPANPPPAPPTREPSPPCGRSSSLCASRHWPGPWCHPEPHAPNAPSPPSHTDEEPARKDAPTPPDGACEILQSWRGPGADWQPGRERGPTRRSPSRSCASSSNQHSSHRPRELPEGGDRSPDVPLSSRRRRHKSRTNPTSP